jgi:GNAT superfamily N-acetyltransferase
MPNISTDTRPVAPGHLEVRPAAPEDSDHILRLVRLSLGEGKIPRDPDYWSWKHAENPFGASPMLVAEANGEVVGLRVFMRWRWTSGGMSIPAVRAVDTATHPAWRGRGIFSDLTRRMIDRMRDEGVALVFNTPNDQSRPGYLKMGWISIGRTSFWVKPLRPLRVVRSLTSSNDTSEINGAVVVPGFADASAFLDGTDGEMLRRFLATVHAGEQRLVTPRNEEYLRWRYARIPGFSYQAAGVVTDGHGALAVFRKKTQSGQRELRFSELLVGPTRRSIAQGTAIVREAMAGSDADFATAMAAPGTPDQRVLLRCGFLPAPRLGPTFTVRPINRLANGLNPLRRRSWRAAAGDLELF